MNTIREIADIRSTAKMILGAMKERKGQTIDRLALLEILALQMKDKAREADRELQRGESAERKAMRRYLVGGDIDPAERKSLEAQCDPRGGFLLGEQLLEEVIDAQAQASAMRRLARSFTLDRGYDSAAAPRQDSRLSDAGWTTELSGGAADAIEPFGSRKLEPSPIAKWVKVSKRLLRVGGPLAEQTIIVALAEAVGVPSEAAFVDGDGIGKPLGVLRTPGLGAHTTAGAGALTIADIKAWIGGLAGRHHSRATALMHVDTYSAMLQLDTAGALFQAGRLLGKYPIEFSDQFPTAGDNPAALTSGTTIAVIGDFSRYWIIDSLESSVQRLMERFAATAEDAFIIRAELDGMAVDSGAFYALEVQ